VNAAPPWTGSNPSFSAIVGVGGIGTGTLIELQGDHTLGRTESRLGKLFEARDYCKLHIVEHYLAVLLNGSRKSGCRVVAVGNVGSDDAGSKLLQEMKLAGIDVQHVLVEPGRGTLFSVSFLYPDKSSCNVTISNSAAAELANAQLDACRAELAALRPRAIALCLPEVPLSARSRFLNIATECDSFRVASFAAGEMDEVRRLNLLSNVDLLAVNREEAAALGGLYGSAARQDLLEHCRQAAVARNPSIRLVVSSGSQGVDVFTQGTWSHYEALPVNVVSTAGAGDALLAGIIAGLVLGLPLVCMDEGNVSRSAMALGLLIAAFSLTSQHTIHPDFSMDALRAFAAAGQFVFPLEDFASGAAGHTSTSKAQPAGTSR